MGLAGERVASNNSLSASTVGGHYLVSGKASSGNERWGLEKRLGQFHPFPLTIFSMESLLWEIDI